MGTDTEDMNSDMSSSACSLCGVGHFISPSWILFPYLENQKVILVFPGFPEELHHTYLKLPGPDQTQNNLFHCLLFCSTKSFLFLLFLGWFGLVFAQVSFNTIKGKSWTPMDIVTVPSGLYLIAFVCPWFCVHENVCLGLCMLALKHLSLSEEA